MGYHFRAQGKIHNIEGRWILCKISYHCISTFEQDEKEKSSTLKSLKH